MELKEFISQSLQQIAEGVAGAQNGSSNSDVNAGLDTKELGGNLIHSGECGVFTRVDFDVSISAESKGQGGGKLAVWGAGIEGVKEARRGNLSRLSFSVPLRLSDGDQTIVKRVNEQVTETIKRAKKNDQGWVV